MAIGGHQVGPVTQDEIIANLRNGSIDARDARVHRRDGQLAEDQGRVRVSRRSRRWRGPPAGRPTAAVPPGRRAHDIDFVIHGNEMQFVEVELDPGESAVAEAGVMMYMTPASRWRPSSATAAAGREAACSTRCSAPASAS
jgi:hypothetical protein